MNLPEDPLKHLRKLTELDPLGHVRAELSIANRYGLGDQVEKYLQGQKHYKDFESLTAVSRQFKDIERLTSLASQFKEIGHQSAIAKQFGDFEQLSAVAAQFKKFEHLTSVAMQFQEIERLTEMGNKLGFFNSVRGTWDGAAGASMDLSAVATARKLLSQYDVAGGSWLSAVRAATAIFDPIEDLRNASGSLSVLDKYLVLAATDPFPMMNMVFDHAMHEHGRMAKGLPAFDQLFSSMSALARVHAEHDAAGILRTVDGDFHVGAPSSILGSAGVDMTAMTPAALVQLIEGIVKALLASTNVQEKQIFWTRVYPLILVLFTLVLAPVADHYIKRALADPAPAAAQQKPKQVNKTVRALGLPFMLLSSHRYVDVKSSLPVRATARMNARTIGRLARAEVVQTLEANGNWTLVRWTDKNQTVLLQGWVSSRYLKKFH